jgi:hypothetical protein
VEPQPAAFNRDVEASDRRPLVCAAHHCGFQTVALTPIMEGL